ncbi:unnamed protein product (macronuclear) [Paramecium tetraurelia]|uniref:Uncharacterized protein n=1 Tax=Paramecium tetraurelia TaxID=5888 RepID=A0EH97_PARTE|nr:uncharacterized protein GSPATT00027012001 [Paramecium tetraurelia]CAK94688.1 unnamed protein product [Paramecium tetraurelia]|eukprot:XP_001462061.1 hypothetical protein (macronuclear) [Paramecium tetraurelia strain d4-2]
MAKACKTRTCSDTKKTKSSECALALVGCISDGIKCIDKGKCSDYGTKEACSVGGTDGVCVFNPTSGSTKNGICKLFTQCSVGNSDQRACQNMPLTCKWTVATGTTSSSCVIHTCDSAAKGTAKCVTIPSFDGKQYTVCQPKGSKCVVGEPSSLTQDAYYKLSQYTYSCNAQTKKCIACGAGSSSNNNSTSINKSLDNPTNSTTDNYGSSLYVLLIFIYFIF